MTLSQPDSRAEAARLDALPRCRGRKGGPVFAEPWQAQAFALAVKLSDQGYFTWKEWAATLGDESKPRKTAASRTMAPTIMSTGSPPWSGSSSTRA